MATNKRLNFKLKDIQNESEEMEKDIPSENKKKDGVAILILDKIDFKTKKCKKKDKDIT